MLQDVESSARHCLWWLLDDDLAVLIQPEKKLPRYRVHVCAHTARPWQITIQWNYFQTKWGGQRVRRSINTWKQVQLKISLERQRRRVVYVFILFDTRGPLIINTVKGDQQTGSAVNSINSPATAFDTIHSSRNFVIQTRVYQPFSSPLVVPILTCISRASWWVEWKFSQVEMRGHENK